MQTCQTLLLFKIFSPSDYKNQVNTSHFCSIASNSVPVYQTVYYVYLQVFR